MMFRKVYYAGVFLTVALCTARASTITFTNLAAFDGATTGDTTVGFNGILPAATPFQGFNPLTVSGVHFATPTSGVVVNVTTANFYSPNNYPKDFIVDSSSASPVNTLNITFTSPVTAFGLDYGQLFGGGTGVMTLSDGTVFIPGSLPTVGNTAFVGFVSTSPITELTFAVTGESWVVDDVVLGSAASAPEPASWGLTTFALAAMAFWTKRRSLISRSRA